jgi:hypothetical protein
MVLTLHCFPAKLLRSQPARTCIVKHIAGRDNAR